MKQIDTLKIYSHEITSYAAIIDDIPGYYKHSMELLDAETRNDVFYGEGTIFTKVKDSVPTRYLDSAKVENSLIADGCVIDGTVKTASFSAEFTLKRARSSKTPSLWKRA